MFSVTVWLGAWQPQTGRRLRDCRREKGISCLHNVPSTLPWCLILESLNRKETNHHCHVLHYMNDSSLTCQCIYAHGSCTSCLVCSVGCWRAFLQDRRAWLQSGVRANHLDDFFQGASPSLLKCQVCTKAMPFNVESEWLGHTISRFLRSPCKEDKCSCRVKDKHCDICVQ